MNEKREPLSTTFPAKFIKTLRKHALIDNRITMSEMIERYQNAYNDMLELEKGKVSCFKCDKKIKKFEDIRGVLCQECVKG